MYLAILCIVPAPPAMRFHVQVDPETRNERPGPRRAVLLLRTIERHWNQIRTNLPDVLERADRIATCSITSKQAMTSVTLSGRSVLEKRASKLPQVKTTATSASLCCGMGRLDPRRYKRALGAFERFIK